MKKATFEKMLAKRPGLVCITGMRFPDWLNDIEADRPLFYLPERGLNISNQAAVVSTIEKERSNAIIVTQSAFIVSDFPRTQVFFLKGHSAKHPDFETFGASANKINMCLFGRALTIGDRAAAALEKMKRRLEKGEDPTTIINETVKTFGDSVESTLFLNVAMDKEKEIKH